MTTTLEAKLSMLRVSIKHETMEQRATMARLDEINADLAALLTEFTSVSQEIFMRDNSHKVYADITKIDAQAAASATRALVRLNLS